MREKEFVATVLKYYKAHSRRDLPWRKTHAPYKILVSEVMLQQTQVERVIPYYKKFLARFPNAQALASASLADVLVLWQGLGYNRRAKMLHEAAKVAVKDNSGRFPENPEALEKLPGIGHYTARAVAAFAHNQDVVFIETNIRTAVTHHFFPRKKKVDDKEVLSILKRVLVKGNAREWYAALMDYGAHLKRSGVKLNAKSKHYTKQGKFTGSGRQARGAILRELAKGAATTTRLVGLLGPERNAQINEQLTKLLAEGLVEKHRTVYRLPA